jgi:diguanylate cyclase (GGDEF)-like protein/PAS domain S-box-containing protein
MKDRSGEPRSRTDAPDDPNRLPFPLLVLSPDGVIGRVNPAAEAALGTLESELVGRPFIELVGTCWRKLFEEALAGSDPSAQPGAFPSRASLDVPLQTASGMTRFGVFLASGRRAEMADVHVLLHPALDSGSRGRTPHSVALDATEDAVLCTDLDGRVLYCNRRFLEMWRIPESALPGDHDSLLRAARDQLEDPEAVDAVREQGRAQPDRESRVLLHLRGQRSVERHSQPLRIGQHLVGLVISFRDVTRQQRAQETIRSSERRYRLLFERNVAGVFRASPVGMILEVNDAFARLVGYDTPAELQGKPITDFYASLPERRRFGEELKRSRAVANREIQFARKDGSTIWVLESSILVEDSELLGPVIEGTIVDITARKRLESELERMAYHDPLTDLANRRLLEERAHMSLAFADRHGIQAGLVYLDLSRFKRVNDTLGHEAGDILLIEVADRIRSCLRGSDTAARIGGDEFACLLAEVGGERGALAVAERIAASLSAPFELGVRTLHVDAQIGVALYPDHASDFEGLLAAADRAMYKTKLEDNPAIEVYSPSMDRPLPDELAEEEELREAMERHEFSLHYQPIVRIADGRLIGAEALIRWNHPTRGLLDAREFIPVAERCGAIRQLDEWVREEAVRQSLRWKGRASPRWISVNQSVRTLRDPDMAEAVTDLFRRAAVPPGRIVLEVKEAVAAYVKQEAVAQRLLALRALGLLIALDDFGTGQSTLAYIRHFPADMIKLDGFFVTDIGTNHDSRNLVKAVIQLGRSLGVTTIAEKVETGAQFEWLRSAGCDCVQGYFTGRPVPADQLGESSKELQAGLTRVTR